MCPDVFMFGGGIVSAGDQAAVLARGSAAGRIYLKFTATHPIDGSRTFYWGDSAFVVELVEVVYPVVVSWGAMRQFLAQDGQDRQSELDVELAGLAYCVASGATKRYQIKDLANALIVEDVLVEFFQWDDASGVSTLIWSGYVREFGRMESRAAAISLHLICGARPITADLPISEVIDATAYPKAPQGSLGRMLTREYGDLTTKFDSTASLPKLPPVAFGYGGRFVPGIDVDDSITSVLAKIVFTKNDGISNSFQANAASTDKPDGDFWVYLPDSGSYASIVNSDMAVFNGAPNLYMTVKRVPRALACFRSVEIGTQMASGLSNDAYKATDDDATNYIETTVTDFVLAWKVPIVAMSQGRILDARVAVDVHHVSSIKNFDVGLWNVAAGTWLGAKKQNLNTQLDRTQQITAVGNVYTQADLATNAEFSSGRLITRDGSGNEKPVEIRIEVLSAGAGLRLYSVALVLLIELPSKSVDVRGLRLPRPGYEFLLQQFQKKTNPYINTAFEVATPLDSVSGTQFLFGGKGQKDDTSGTITGTPSALIQKAPDVAREILQVLKGYSVNGVAGSLGNFVDARTEVVSKEKQIACRIGIDVKSTNDAIVELQRRWPMRLEQVLGKWLIFGDDMNPHSSRLYRSASAPIRISAKKHIDIESFSCPTTSPRGILNNVQLNYAHDTGTGKPMGTTSYAHPLSRETYMYGAKDLVTIDEPWIPRNDLINENPHPAATFLAKWLGTKAARARCLPKFKVSQALFDISQGYVFEFEDDMESAGLYCPAKRCGLLDYAYTGTTEGTNYANDSAPYLMWSSAGISYFLVSQQVDGLDFSVGTAGVFTSVANAWKYWNGTALVALSGVTNVDAFKSTGVQKVRWTRPLITSVQKAEFVFNGISKGPSYCYTFENGAVTTRARGNAATTYPAKWIGRVLEVIEATRRPGSMGQYPHMEIVAQEVM